MMCDLMEWQKKFTVKMYNNWTLFVLLKSKIIIKDMQTDIILIEGMFSYILEEKKASKIFIYNRYSLI